MSLAIWQCECVGRTSAVVSEIIASPLITSIIVPISSPAACMYVNTTAKTARSNVDFKFTATLVESDLQAVCSAEVLIKLLFC